MIKLRMSIVIRITDLWKHYGKDERNGAALRGTNLEVHSGQIIALFGKSGSGKTTLLNIIAGLDMPTSGKIEIEGHDIMAIGERGRTEFRRRRLGFVFQFFNLLPTLTAFENVALALELAGRKNIDDAHAALESVGLAGKGNRYPHELSGGEQQRTALARAIVKKPALILADEPTGNVDSATGARILELLTTTCRQSNTTLIMVSHAPMTCRYADRILSMVDGIIVEEKSPESLNT